MGVVQNHDKAPWRVRSSAYFPQKKWNYPKTSKVFIRLPWKLMFRHCYEQRHSIRWPRLNCQGEVWSSQIDNLLFSSYRVLQLHHISPTAASKSKCKVSVDTATLRNNPVLAHLSLLCFCIGCWSSSSATVWCVLPSSCWWKQKWNMPKLNASIWQLFLAVTIFTPTLMEEHLS